jgi:hypothetical protein
MLLVLVDEKLCMIIIDIVDIGYSVNIVHAVYVA